MSRATHLFVRSFVRSLAGTGTMDVTAIQEAFDRVSKKQKLCYTKTQDVIDRTLHEVEAAAAHLNGLSDWKPDVRKSVFTDLQLKLTEIAPLTQVSTTALHCIIYFVRFLFLVV